MAQYRSLTQGELKELEKEFVDYLIINGFTGEDWEKMKVEAPEKAEKIIDLFSDVVFEGALRKMEYLEHRTSKQLVNFHCKKDEITMVGISIDDDAEGDFTDKEFLNKALKDSPKGLKIFTKDNPYSKTREMEMFEMIAGGCLPADGKVYKTLCMLIPEKFNSH